MLLIGLPLGAFVGALSGFLFLLILRAGFQGSGLKHIGLILGELTALVTFALGGSWFANSHILKATEASDVLSPYLLSFALVFFAVVCVPFYQIIARFGRQFGEMQQVEEDKP